jgi:hypothetical protein
MIDTPFEAVFRNLPRAFDFRYSNRIKLGVDDAERTDRAVKGIVGKRLTYRRIGRARSEAGNEA